MRYDLVSHPDFPSGAIESLAVRVSRPSASLLKLRFRSAGNLANTLVPDEVAPRFADGLWRHSCFEAFVRTAGDRAYTEFNFSPSGRFAAYHFDDYRLGMRALPDLRVERVLSVRTDDCLEDHWAIEVPTIGGERVGLAFSAVIEETDGTKSYWALAHPPGPPDFHHPACFAATLPPSPRP